jgi:hypothetical protein
MAQRAAPLMWRYSLRWCLPRGPWVGPHELLISSTATNKDQGDVPPGPPILLHKGVWASTLFLHGAGGAWQATSMSLETLTQPER